jgi:S-DNA-T family DNA segregation ATPase FtsK/SpoIIIE
MTLPVFAPRPASGEAAPTKVAPANTRAPTVLGRGAAVYRRRHEVAALLMWTVALFLILALATYRGDPPVGIPMPAGPAWVGPVGDAIAGGLVALIGVVAWALPLELCLLGVPLVRGRASPVTPGRVAGDLLITVVGAALVQVGAPGRTAFGAHPAAGLVGELFGELARSLFSTAGSFLVGFACLGLILIGRAAFSFIALARLAARAGARTGRWLAAAARAVARAWALARELERERKDRARVASEPRIDTSPKDEAVVAVLPFDEDDGVAAALAEEPRAPPRRGKARGRAASSLPSPPPSSPSSSSSASAEPFEGPFEGPMVDAPPAVDPALEPEAAPTPTAVDPEPRSDAAASSSAVDPGAKARRPRKAAPTIVDTSAALEKEAPPSPEVSTRSSSAAFTLPSMDFLVPEVVDASVSIDRDKLLANAQTLVETLAHYGVQGKVEDILPGPTVTTYEVSPAVGTKVSKVAGLADDLALALARKVRIVAPIPGKNRIGFELPNDKRVHVVLRDLIEDRRFQALTVPLPVVLGRDILGNPMYADLASMPHVIVAGATGAGKSVGLNVMLLSLLYRRSPDELRLLMIDPKVVELAPFDRIPHMLLPVVTDMKQAANALKWAVDEMERRYQLFADAGTKNIATYNGWAQRVARGEAINPNAKTVIAKDHNGLPEEIPARGGEGEARLPEKLPWVVIVVDEFADLMMQQGKEVESAIARLAQKARAAGMHVILATQRPSTDVITGTIKANFPTRIAYRVAQKVDSRTILDEQGAEHLLGMGDMLIKLNGTGETKRVQCPWVSEEEVQRVTDFLRTQGEPVYDDNILKPRDEDAPPDEPDAEQDPLYDDAVRLVADTRRCSTSWLQRKLGLGYNRAARIVETMERRGLVGPANGAKDREVLVGSL